VNAKDISVVITSFNEAPNIERCLKSVAGFGETVLVDSFSTDDTVQIARSHPATIYSRPYRSAAAQKNWALERVRNEWVLVLDADEALTEALRAEIERLVPEGVDGYWIRRRSDYLGAPIRGCGWQRDKVLRLFRRARGRYDGVHVHEEVSLATKPGMLRERMVHHPYRDIGQHFDKINEYSTRGAKDYLERGGRFALLNMLLHPPMRFLRMYLWQRGFIDGVQGLTLCLLASYSVFLKYAKAWEQGKR
jgi:glycosyltransferase involved in cell wall biosynthesis